MGPFHTPDTWLFRFGGAGADAVLDAARALAKRASGRPLEELAAEAAVGVDPAAPVRAAIVAGSPHELEQRVEVLAHLANGHLADGHAAERHTAERRPGDGHGKDGKLADGAGAGGVGSAGEASFAHRRGEVLVDPTHTVFWSSAPATPTEIRVGFLFPGQGCQRLQMGRVLVDRFPWAKLMVREADSVLASVGARAMGERVFRPFGAGVSEAESAAWFAELSDVEVAGPAIQVTSAMWARYLGICGVHPACVGGHSQGEQAAFHAAGAVDFPGLVGLGAFMGRAGSAAYNTGPAGAMAVLGCSREAAEELVRAESGYAVVANINAPAQVVLAGEREAVERVAARAAARGVEVRPLPVSNAFHTRLVAEGGEYMRANGPALPAVGELRAELFSCLDGERVPRGTRPLDHFADMATRPVDFVALLRSMAARCDLMIEVGAGRALSGLAQSIEPGCLCLPVEPVPGRTRALHAVWGALFVHGAPVKWDIALRGLEVKG